MSDDQAEIDRLLQIKAALEAVVARKERSRLSFYQPYPKQYEFHALGNTIRERLLMAGNQTGKTWCGGNEAAYHLTGLYPEGWPGRIWRRPTRGWVAGVTGESTRDNPQRILLGTQATGIGTGSIPADCIVDLSLARGVSDLYDTVIVKNAFGGNSEMKFKSYERGRTKWQGDTLDWLWFDEEPDMDVYSEGLTRISATKGMVWVTFTPLLGMSDVVTRYLSEPSPDRAVVTMTIEDAEHIPAEERTKIIAGYTEHEREARAKGVPMLGSGRVFPYTEESITVDDFPVPHYWALLWGLDFGTDHPFAAVLLAHDRDNDVVYALHCIRQRGTLPIDHCAAIKAYGGSARGREFGKLIPAAWPQDMAQRREDQGQLKPLADIYRKHGVKMLPKHAHFEGGSRSTEAGVMELSERMRSSRFKVFRSCSEWFAEYRMYHRKDGLIVKERDDLMSATRVGIMDLRNARVVFMDGRTGDDVRGQSNMAKDIDFDLFD